MGQKPTMEASSGSESYVSFWVEKEPFPERVVENGAQKCLSNALR